MLSSVRSLSRRDRQGSQPEDTTRHVCGKSIEEGPAGFPTAEAAPAASPEVYRGGTGRVPNMVSATCSGLGSLSRRDRQGSQLDHARRTIRRKSIEEGPAGFPTSLTTRPRSEEVYRGGTGRVPNATGSDGTRTRSLSRRDRQGSQRFGPALVEAEKSIDEEPAGFPTFGRAPRTKPEVYRGGTGRVPNNVKTATTGA